MIVLCTCTRRFDAEHTEDDRVHVDCFCVIADGIEENANGNILKDVIVKEGFVQACIDYVITNNSDVKSAIV